MDVLSILPPHVRKKIEITPECWLWTGGINQKGRPKAMIAGQRWYVHRYVFWLVYGWLPENVHHTCENRLCLRPDHLEGLTKTEHQARHPMSGGALFHAGKTHCPAGHPYTPENTYTHHTKKGWENRQCRICRQEAQKRFKQKRHEEPTRLPA